MDNYLAVNERAYDNLAEAYKEAISVYLDIDEAVLAPFKTYLCDNFSIPMRLLDIGIGSGANLQKFVELGLFTIGVDISAKMIEVAHEICPKAVLIQGNFLDIRFSDSSFEGIIARAIIHLFPKSEAIRFLEKAFNMLVPNGALFLATTVSEEPREGFSEKNFRGRTVLRYRKHWTEEEIIGELVRVGYIIQDKSFHLEPIRNNHWMNIIAAKK